MGEALADTVTRSVDTTITATSAGPLTAHRADRDRPTRTSRSSMNAVSTSNHART